MKIWGGLAAAGLAIVMMTTGTSALAGEGLFSRAYTTDTVPEGHFEIEQLARDRSDRSFGSYNAQDFSSEVEYGVTNDLQAALYVNTGHIDAKNAPDDDDPNGQLPGGFSRNSTYLEGLSAEFIYRALSPYTNGIGLAFYIEPEWNFHDLHNGLSYNDSFGVEYKALVQKNFFDDRLVLVYNLTFETEAIRFKTQYNGQYNGELDWNNNLGATYRFAENWFAGAEFYNHNEYGNFTHHEHSTFNVGPTLHYGGERYWVTASYLRQIYGTPFGTRDGVFVGDHLFLRSHEKNEFNLKIGIPL